VRGEYLFYLLLTTNLLADVVHDHRNSSEEKELKSLDISKETHDGQHGDDNGVLDSHGLFANDDCSETDSGSEDEETKGQHRIILVPGSNDETKHESKGDTEASRPLSCRQVFAVLDNLINPLLTLAFQLLEGLLALLLHVFCNIRHLYGRIVMLCLKKRGSNCFHDTRHFEQTEMR